MNTVEPKVRIPQLVSVENAVRIFYEKVELGSTDVCALFGCAIGKAASLKKVARAQMEEEGIPSWNPLYVNTEVAFRSWGLDIAVLEGKLSKLRRLKLDRRETA